MICHIRLVPLHHIQYRLSITHVNNIQELLVTYDKKIGIMDGNMNEYTITRFIVRL